MEEMSEDELAEVLAVSKKMLRKKPRQEILDLVADRNYSDVGKKNQKLPNWFLADEKKFNKKIPMVSKEEIEVQKEKIQVLKNALPKKVWEAKQRKKKRMVESLKRAHKQSAQIFDNDSFTGMAKARQVRQIYKKAEKTNAIKKKEIIVARRFSIAAPNKKSGRKFQIVDKRMKKDIRGMENSKRIGKRKKGTAQTSKYRRRKSGKK